MNCWIRAKLKWERNLKAEELRHQYFYVEGAELNHCENTVSFTLVIKRSPGGESAGGGRPTSELASVHVVPAWTHTTSNGDWPASSMSGSKFSVRVNSDLGNGSFWGRNQRRWACWSMLLKIYGSLTVSTEHLTSEMFGFWICSHVLQLSCLQAVGAYICLIISRPAGLNHHERLCQVCVIVVTLRGWADVGLIVGSCVLPCENFFT